MDKKMVPVRVYSQFTEDDQKAMDLLKEAGIPFEGPVGTQEQVTPIVVWGLQEYCGLEEIKRFIGEWGSNTLPDPYNLPHLYRCVDL